MRDFRVLFFAAGISFFLQVESHGQVGDSSPEIAVEKKPTLAVLTLATNSSVSASDVLLLSDRLAVELSKTEEFTVVNRRKMEEDNPTLSSSESGNCSDVECAVNIGRMLSVQILVYGSVGMAGSAYVLNTHMVDVETGVILKTASTEGYKSIEDVMTSGIQENAIILAGPEETESSPEKAGRQPLAILPFDARAGIAQDEIDLLSDRFAAEMHKAGKYAIVPRNKMEVILMEQEFSRSDNCAVQDCAIEAGRLLGVRYMAYGSVGNIGRLFTANSSIVDVETGEIVSSATTDYEGNLQDFIVYGIGINANELLGLAVTMPTNVIISKISNSSTDWISYLHPKANNYWDIFESIESNALSSDKFLRMSTGNKWWGLSLKYDVGDTLSDFDDVVSARVDAEVNIPLYRKIDLQVGTRYSSVTASRTYNDRQSYTSYQTYYGWYYSYRYPVKKSRTVKVKEDIEYYDYGVDVFFRLIPFEYESFKPILFVGPCFYQREFEIEHIEEASGSIIESYKDSMDEDDYSLVYGAGFDWRLNPSLSLILKYTDYGMLDAGNRAETDVKLVWHAYDSTSCNLSYTKVGDAQYIGLGIIFY